MNEMKIGTYIGSASFQTQVQRISPFKINIKDNGIIKSYGDEDITTP